jgi:hypothetical protein
MECEASQILQELPNNRWELFPMPEFEGLTSSSLDKMLIYAIESITSTDDV